MSWLRSLLSVAWLVALVASACVPAASATPMGERVAAVATVAAEPCPATHLIKRCDLTALPTGTAQPEADSSSSAVVPGMPLSGRGGVWPDVEPDPPRG